MGIGDTSSRILLSFKSDTSQARAEIKKLSKEQQEAAKSAVAAQERQNKSLESQVAMLGKVALGVGAAVGAYKTLTDAARVYAERSQLMAASGGADINRIQRATQGLITDTQALEFAAAAQASQWTLTQQQMETAAKFAIVLRNKGIAPLEEALRATSQALVEANGEPLKKFGIQVKAASGTAEAFSAVVAKMDEATTGAGNSLLRTGDEAKIAGVKWQDAIDKLVFQLGRLAIKLTPIVSALADIAEFIAGGGPLSEAELEANFQRGAARRAAAAERLRLESMFGRAAANAGAGAAGTLAIPEGGITVRPIDAPKALADVAGAAKGAAGFTVGASVLPGTTPRPGLGVLPGGMGAIGAMGADGPGAGFAGQGLDLQSQVAILSAYAGESARAAEALEHMATAGQKSAGVFERLGKELDVSAVATQFFAESSTQLFASWFDSQQSFEGVLKSIGGTALKALQNWMLGEAAIEGAMAIKSLASLDFYGAATHGAAAAAFAAGAGLAGTLGAELGGSMRGGASAGGAERALPPGSRGLSGGAGGGQSSQTWIVVQDPFDDNPREARRRLDKAMRRANNERGGRGGVIRA